MIKTSNASCCCMLMSLVVLAACSGSKGTLSAQAPAAPTMPAGWTVVSDQSFALPEIKPVAENLGGEVTALRNTLYDVGGKSVKLNTIVTASAADADRIMTSLRAVKPEEFLLRRDLTLYEFVGTNEAIPEMRAGKEHLRLAPGT